jgi:hypothetical protein
LDVKHDPPFIMTKAQATLDREMASLRKVSPLHAARILTRHVVDNAQEEYQRSERSLKKFRLSIENIKEETIESLNNNEIKSPRAWRDNLIAFRIRRKIINRENELTFKQKEELYNAGMMTSDQMSSLERVE